ncbi:MAG: amino acid adenylation domain-containing protein, partial [Synergistaceae bacterium]|nr:amino acid adenylation domain-containing protein [Synergistaceae bacterium]
DLFAVILERITGGGAESRLLCDVAELPPARRAQILESFRGRCTDKDARTVVDMFRERAVLTPGRRAVVFEDRELSYGELDDLTDRLAARLALMRAGSGKNVVGVLVRRSEMMPVGALGVLKSGAAYLPLDPSYPASRLSYMLSDAAVSVVVADRDLRGKLPDFGGKFLYTDEIHGLPASDAEVVPPAPEDLFILLYTSGTTGSPKGVMLSHANLTNFCLWFREHYGLTEDDSVPAYASFGFDACMMDMYPALTTGACVHIIPERMRLELPELNDYFNANGITVAFLTTQLGRQFVEMMDNRSLRALTTGGETLVPIGPPGAYTLYNAYGPTECAIFTTLFRVDGLYDRVPIGKPLYNTSLYIVDGRNRLAPVGTAGELCVAGRQVGMGYLNRPGLTKEKFVPNPFSDDPEYAVMYRTGDFARFLPDGNVDFTGRSDFQVKIRGFRVELTEIEGRIRLYPGITDATVIASDAPGGGKQAVAYIVADSPVDAEALNRFIEDELPPYMVPSATVQMDKIPLNPNGKVDRRALPKPEVQAHVEIVPPATETEGLVLSLAEELCGVKGIGVTANLLRSGLQSLSSIRLAAQIKAHTGLSLSGGDIIRAKTARGIAALLSEARDARGGPPGPPDETQSSPGMSEGAWPLMENQMGIYYECAGDPQSILYNVPVSLDLPADTDPERLRDAFLSVVEVHGCLKARLEERGGDLMFVRSERAADIPIIRTDDAGFIDAKKIFVQPFDLLKGPLFRAKIYRTESSVHLLMDFHHIIFDGASCNIFMEDLANAYQGRPIPPEEISSFESDAEERALEGGEAWNASAEHFKKLLSSFEEVTTLQPDYPAAAGGGAEVSVGVQIPPGGIGDFCRNIGIMPSSLFLGAASLAISRFVRSRSVILCAVSSGRDDPRSRRSVGMRVRTIPLGVRTSPETTVGEYLIDVQDRFFEAIENQLYPLTKISADYGFKPDIMYTYQNVLGETVRFCDTDVKIDLISHGMPAKNPLTVTVTESPAHFGLSLDYDEALYDKLTIKALLEGVVQSLEGLMGRGLSEKISKIPVISEEGARRVAGFNSPLRPNDYPNVFAPIEAQAERTPDAEALIAADGTMTYRELNEAANRLAHGLIDRGLERGDRVVLLLPRDSRVIVSMLGVMKAGGVYIPVDPAYPSERIQQILEDSDARFLIAPGDGHAGASAAKGARILTPEELMESARTDNPGVEVGPDDMIYLIYTSGSTGKPKGVMLRHGGLVNYITNRPSNLTAHLIAETRARMVSVATVSFDAFIDDIYIPLTNGLPVILASEEETGHPERLAELFERAGGTGINVTPSRLQQFMASPRLSRALAACRFFDIGAEQFPPALYRDLSALNPDAIILNSYGPTESSVACNGKIVKDAKGVTAGPPMWNVVESIRDPEGLPLPVGASGELWIGGEGVALGYVINPELTRERFVKEDGIRYYKSGDLAKWTDDGEIVILGRIDEQVKLRGLRIELGEVENAVLSVGGVQNAAVRIRKIRGQEHLCAWFTAERSISPAALREEMSKTLPQYMLPTACLQMKKLPSTISGKVD